MQLLLTLLLVGTIPSGYGFQTEEEKVNTQENAVLALEYVENVRNSHCSGGTGEVLPIEFDHAVWNSQAQVAVRTANFLTKMWIINNGTPSFIDDNYLFGMTRSNVEIDPMIFGSAIAFEEYTYRNYQKVSFYTFEKFDRINSYDLSVNYDYLGQLNTEWYHIPKNKTYQPREVLVHINHRYNSTGNEHAPLEIFSEPLAMVEDGHWTKPYFDCGGGDIWMVTFSSPIFTRDIANASQYIFGGVATVDVELTNIDINQCDAEEMGSSGSTTADVFRNTHLCRPTTKCVPRKNLGFMSGTYFCVCVDGYYFPNTSAEEKAFVGFDLQHEYNLQKKYKNNSFSTGFLCLPCSEGCDTCVDDSACIAASNMIFRGALLAIVFLDVIFAFIVMIAVFLYRKQKIIKAASPFFCYVIIAGMFLMCAEVIIVFFKPTDLLCEMRPWFHHVGYFTTYGALLLRTWRISALFKVKSAKQVKLGDSALAKRLLPILGVTIAYLVAWRVSSPPYVYTIKTPDDLKLYYCSSSWWDYAAILGQCLFLLWGVYLCYSVRKAPSSFNESKFISWAIYNTIFMNNFLLIIRLVMLGSLGPDLIYLLHVLQLQVPCTITLLLIFVPKFYMIAHEGPEAEAGTGVTGRQKASGMSTNKVTPVQPAPGSSTGEESINK